MSRSYKHTPSCGEGKNKFMKNYSNRVIRRKLNNEDFILQGNDYRKVVEPWEIEDYRWYSTFGMYSARHKNHINMFYRYLDANETEEDLYKEWSKWYFRK